MLPEDKQTNLMYLIRYLQKLIDADLDKRLLEHGLTGQQGRVLFFINRKTMIEKEEIHQNDIESEMHLSKSTVSGIVKRMENKGIISIEKQHPFAILKPTQKGLDIICHLSKHRLEALDILLKDVSKKDEVQLLKTLVKLINNMEGEKENA